MVECSQSTSKRVLSSQNAGNCAGARGFEPESRWFKFNPYNQNPGVRDHDAITQQPREGCFGPFGPHQHHKPQSRFPSFLSEIVRPSNAVFPLSHWTYMDATFAGEPPLLEVKSVARILGLHPGTVLRLARTGKIPALRYARHWRFRSADLASWIAAQKFVPPSPSSSRIDTCHPV